MNKSRKNQLKLILILLAGLFVSTTNAQNEKERGLFTAGFEGGINFSQVDGDYYAGYGKQGARFGAIGFWNFKEDWAISWEIAYSQRGSNASGWRVINDSISIANYGINAVYAEVPVMLNYFDDKRNHFGLGLSYSQLVQSSEHLQISKHNTLSDVDLSKYTFNKNNVEIVAGGTLHMWKGLFLNVRFQYSIIPMRTDIPEIYARSKQYSNVWTTQLYYLFRY